MTTGTASPSELLPEGAPDSVREIVDAKGEDAKAPVTPQAEHDAVYWLLRNDQVAPRSAVDVKFETPEGTMELVFVLQAIAGPKIDQIERMFYNEDPLKIDDQAMACSLVAEAIIEVRDKMSGNTVDVNSKAFLGPNLMVADALRGRFVFQSGVMVSLANEVRRISGWGPDRVGKASRVLVDLTGKS